MKKIRKEKEPKKRYQSIKVKIVNILQERSDVTRTMLPELLGKKQNLIDSALAQLRKAGYRIWPSKGAGTPLRIANSQLQAAKFIEWRRERFLPTVKRMIIQEHEIGEEYRALSASAPKLLEILNNSTQETREK